MKKFTLILLLFSFLFIISCSDNDNKVTPEANLTFDEIKGTYLGTTYEDIPDGSGGYTSSLLKDTLSIAMLSGNISLVSSAMGRLTATQGSASPANFELKFASQPNGKMTPTGGSYKVATGAKGANLIIELFNGKCCIIRADTLETDTCDVCTRYRMVSLEK